MRLSLGQEMRMVQKQILAPRMIQSMEILQLPIQALEERIEQEVDVASRDAQGEHDESPQREPGRRHQPGLQAAPPADPAKLRRCRVRAKGARDGEGRVDVPARTACRDRHSHSSLR